MSVDRVSEVKASFQKARMEQYYEDARARLKVVAETGFLFVKSMLILSGGAVVVLLALVKPGGGNVEISNPTALLWSFGLFGTSALLTIVSVFVAYLGQDEMQSAEGRTAMHVYDLATGDPNPEPFPDDLWDRGRRYGIVAIAVAASGVAAFGGGFVAALVALAVKAVA